MKKLNKEFFSYDTEIVAKNIMWKVLKVWDKMWIIQEVEIYKWNCDPASHAYWKKTLRNSLMYDTYWFVYVYLIYGIHYCLNFTTDIQKPWAILIRGVLLFDNKKLISWPGKLTKYFGIDKSFNWLDLEKTTKIGVYDIWFSFNKIGYTTRIWISKAKDKLWRLVWYL